MFCSNCGKEIDDNAVVCIHCGVSTKAGGAGGAMQEDGELGCLLGGLCFLFPIVGLILYLVWKNEMPNKAKQAGKWALIGFIVSMAISIIYGIIIGVAATTYY
ncbi:MAG: zinc ribbon domain-containing protein [Candidatus Cloacimonadaceae bacterium]|jgi:hypothetical protein|nr:zinc ribbon domain-containing protein [Candidatus Cloacimonadota bacterium]MDY0128216.1 zinc ribbon domain-containing protein [Candidatus Cloacimonadaceae bacterium]MCB5254289.1 zinc ribbon domain-containing protein [Candidatus Cloacimonadota bacterium]MCK9178545.1 zinc ribbon domain-containing protein [Candidatus Cloacimonadota bacterium]MCK9242753.1 zinc ribbon domain-containing protein [Candidatus Cloacimonadota bacterium]